jgi:hypothetical protein
MDYPEGFFPEREILAMRRRQQLQEKPVERADSQRTAVWIVLGLCFLNPMLTALWSLDITHRPRVLLVACYLLAGFAVAGFAIGLYRGLRFERSQRFTVQRPNRPREP